MLAQRLRSRKRPRLDWPSFALGVATLALGGVALVLSRRRRVPGLAGIDSDALEPLAHVGMGLILAVVAAVLLAGIDSDRAVLKGFATSVFVTTAIEVAQISLPSRTANIEDGLLNVGGALLGAFVAWALLQAPPEVSPRQAAAVLVLIGLIGGVWALKAEVALGQSCDHTATELGSPGPPPPDLATDADLLAYDFSAAQAGDVVTVHESGAGATLFESGFGAIELSPVGVVFAGGDQPAALRSHIAGAAVSAAVQASDSLVLEVIVTPSGDALGPTPIVAISGSSNPSDMNVNLGQHGSELSVRLRLGCGQFNWTRIPDVFEPGVRRDVIVSYAAGTQRVWVDGALVDERTFRGERISTRNWNLVMPLVLGNEVSNDRQFSGEIELVRIG